SKDVLNGFDFKFNKVPPRFLILQSSIGYPSKETPWSKLPMKKRRSVRYRMNALEAFESRLVMSAPADPLKAVGLPALFELRLPAAPPGGPEPPGRRPR